VTDSPAFYPPIWSGLFKNVFMTSKCIASSDRQIDGNELERVWKEATLAQFRAKFQNLLKKRRNTMITPIRIAAVPSEHLKRDLNNICRNCSGLSQFTKYFEVYKPNVISVRINQCCCLQCTKFISSAGRWKWDVHAYIFICFLKLQVQNCVWIYLRK
jgi:hypothetical protein